MKTGIVKDRRFLAHTMGPYHPESPARLEAIYGMIEKEPAFSTLRIIEPVAAREEEIAMIHSPAYVRTIKETAGKERVYLDPDTSTCARSYEAASLAVGGLLKACDLIMAGEIRNAFGLVRPPGHHAEASQAMGFCLFNNVAVAAEHLIQKHGLERILIVDWDLHHGNGTQHAFYTRNDVLFFSTHQFPYYPGTGNWDEIGAEKGTGYTINVPLSPGKEDKDFLFIFKNILAPVVMKYKPEFILVSAGFDIADGDPLGGMLVTSEGFGALSAELLRQADESAGGRILFTLEGGYSLRALQEGVREVLFRLCGRKTSHSIRAEASPETKKETAPLLEIIKKFW